MGRSDYILEKIHSVNILDTNKSFFFWKCHHGGRVCLMISVHFMPILSINIYNNVS